MKYVCLNRKCDLAFFAVEWKKIKNERDRVYCNLLDSYQRINKTYTQTEAVWQKIKNKVNTLVQKIVIRVIRLQI